MREGEGGEGEEVQIEGQVEEKEEIEEVEDKTSACCLITKTAHSGISFCIL